KNEFEFDFQKDLTQYLPDQDIAILTPPMPLPRDRNYIYRLREFFSVLNEFEIGNLIIDLRNNLGGLSQDPLASFLADSNYVYVENSMKGTGTPSYKEYIKGKLSLNFFTVKMFSMLANSESMSPHSTYVEAAE